MFIYLPITLLDSDGYETEIKSLEELEGTLQMAVEACESFNNDSDTGSDSNSEDSSTSDSDGSDDGANDGSGIDSESDADDSSDDDSGDDSDDNEVINSVGSTFVESDQTDEDDNDKDYKFCDKNNKKVYICHKGKTICVSVNAIWAHTVQHGDALGTCED